MVQEAAKFTDEEILEFLTKNKANIQNLSRKFYYFTYLKKADLLQEGRLKIIELLRAFERYELGCEREDLDKYIGRCLMNHYVSLVRKYPSDDYIDPAKFAFSHGETTEDLENLIIYILLNEELTEQEQDIVVLLLEDHTRQEISEILGISVRSLSRLINKKIRPKLEKYI